MAAGGETGGRSPGGPRDRVAGTLADLERTDVEIVVVARPDGARRAAMERARDAAIAAGRGSLLDEATTAAREIVIRAFARRGFSGTWAVADWSISTSGPRDRAAVAFAFEEAVTAAVVEDLVDEETLGSLRATSAQLAMMTGVPQPGALSNVGLGILRSGAMSVAALIVAVALIAIGSVMGAAIGLVIAAVAIGWLIRLRSRSSPR